MSRRLPLRVLWVLVLAAAAGILGARFAAPGKAGGAESRDAVLAKGGQAESRSAALAKGSEAESRRGAPSPVSASTRPNPLSCKPSLPVVTTLVSSGVPETWHVRIEALEPVSSVEVSLGARAGEQDLSSPLAVWQGALAQGESRDFDVQYAPPAGASEVWADARMEALGGMQRSRAALTVRDGRVVSQIDAVPQAGRVVVDPASGLEVIEAVGVQGGAR